MTPNLLLATQTLFSPHKWFKTSRVERPKRKTEHWDEPVAGIYEYIPGRGWYLVATDITTDGAVHDGGPVIPAELKSGNTLRVTQPIPVKYSKVLKRYFLAPDYDMRKQYGEIEDSRGKRVEVGFFRLDSGVAWVQCWDEEGEFVPGPYKLWCIDAHTNKFRHMLKGDDPNYVPSRANSIDGDHGSRRNSQDSRSTQFRSGPGSMRDAFSVPGTRANSIKGLTPSNPTSNPTSHPGSQANSRRSSPKRSPAIPLDEAKARLRVMAQEQAAAISRASSDESITRGRRLN